MLAPIIDLNCDLGEFDDARAVARDDELLSIVTSANVACGGHAGTLESMERSIRSAMAHGVAIGAHPAFNDRQGFGRRPLDIPLTEVMQSVREQVAAFQAVARRLSAPISHVKPHGALYHRISDDERFASAFAATVRSLDERAVLLARAGSKAVALWRSDGIACAAEAFVDRGYCSDGTLLPREHPLAVVRDPLQAGVAAIGFARHRFGLSVEGRRFELWPVTLCVHSDSPAAVAMARAARAALESAGVRLSAESLGALGSA